MTFLKAENTKYHNVNSQGGPKGPVIHQVQAQVLSQPLAWADLVSLATTTVSMQTDCWWLSHGGHARIKAVPRISGQKECSVQAERRWSRGK